MKKILSVTAIIIALILLIIIILPFAFKGKILEIAKKEVNKSANVQIDFGNLSLNFFKHFPNATVSLENVYIIGTAEFEKDTLLFSKNLSATVNLKSLFGNSGYEITQIGINEANVHAIVAENGTANWEFFDDKENIDEEKKDESDFKLQLKKVVINNSDVSYEDRSSKMNMELKGINLTLSGNLTADETAIKTHFTVDALSFIMDKIPYLSKAKTEATMEIAADLKNMKFTLADNHIQINEIKATIDGWVAMLEDESIEMDLKLNAPTTQFKDVLSMIPAIYAKDFKDIKTSGEAVLEASAKGIMKEEILPSFDVKLKVSNAMFQYPDMPKSVTNIHADLHAYNKGGSPDNTIIDVSEFHFNMGGNPFDVRLKISSPMSDMNVNLSATGKLNLGMIQEVYPLENMELSGILDANMKLTTRMSYIEKEQYDKIEASGNLNVKEMSIKSENSEDIRIQNAHLAFSPRYVDLTDCSVQIGKNDIAAKGKLENFIPYFMKDETLKGNLTVNSTYLNLNDFMSEEESVSPDSTSVGVIVIPKNLDFNLNGRFAHVIFDKLEMKNVIGQIMIKDGKADLKNVSANALGGNMIISGYYDTGKNPEQPEVSMNLNINGASFAQTFSTFVTIQKLAPIFEHIAGNYSSSFKLNSALGSDFMPILTSITADGLLQSNNVDISNVAILDGLASTLKNESLKEMKIKDLKLPFSVNEGRITTKPFDINFGEGRMNLSGTTGIDQTIDYTAKVNLSDKLANNYLKNLVVKIGGTFTNPKFSLDTKAATEDLLENIVGSMLGGNKTIETVKEDVSGKINEQIETIRSKAKETGDKLIGEAERQGQKLIDEANKTSNPIAKIAAVKAAEAGSKKLKEEAQKQANKLIEEAEKQIQSLKKE